jgi:RNA recognition motif-containing protein
MIVTGKPSASVQLPLIVWFSDEYTSSAPKGGQDRDDDNSVNPGSNLFVTGIHPKLTEQEVTRLFEKYGEVEKCQIMRDPHSKESRGFGFVKMVTSDMADAAKEGLQGEIIEGRTLSIEKARRARPRTPTPGKYFGPPKRGESAPTPVVLIFID